MKRLNDPFAPTPEGFRLRMEQTLNGLEENEMNPRFKFTAATAIALAVLLLTATALAASAYFGGTLDWNGNFTPYTEEEYLDTLPDPTPRPDMSSDAAMDEILAGVPDGEYWQFRTESGGHGRFGSNMILFDSVRDMQSLLTGFDLPVPETGSVFSLIDGYVFFDSDPFVSEPYASEEYDFGTLYKYRLTEETLTGGVGCYIDLRCGGETVHINVYSDAVSEEGDDYAVTVGPDETVIPLSVPGYDAFCVEFTDENGFHRTVSLRKIENDRRIRIDIFTDSETVSPEILLSLF